MFNIFKKKKELPTIVGIHGFGMRRTTELRPLVDYFEKIGYNVICPVIFDLSNEEDNNMDLWISRCELVVDELLKDNKQIILVGFSMGGVIASKIAAERHIKKLILIAPAFTYLTINNAVNFISKSVNLQDSKNKQPELPSTFFKTFTTIVDTYKDKINNIIAPCLIIHGIDDEVIPYNSSCKAIKKIKNSNAHLIILDSCKHRVLDDQKYSRLALENINLFINNKL